MYPHAKGEGRIIQANHALHKFFASMAEVTEAMGCFKRDPFPLDNIYHGFASPQMCKNLSTNETFTRQLCSMSGQVN